MAWLVGLAAIAMVTYLFWFGSAAVLGMIVPGNVVALELIPAGIVALTPLGWYLWVTVIDPLRLRAG